MFRCQMICRLFQLLNLYSHSAAVILDLDGQSTGLGFAKSEGAGGPEESYATNSHVCLYDVSWLCDAAGRNDQQGAHA